MISRILFSAILVTQALWAQVTDSSISVSWFAMQQSDGVPQAGFSFEVQYYDSTGAGLGNQQLVTDSSGMVEGTHPPLGTRSLQVRATHPEKTIQSTRFAMDPASPYAQFTLEIGARAKVAATGDTTRKMQQLVVVADRAPLHERKQVSKRTVSREEMREVGSTENDPFKVLGTLPGIVTINDLSVRPYMRGGDEWETRTFWNGVPILHPFHALSMYSIFNMEAIADMTVYTGGFPAEGSNSLSGALWLRSRPAPLDSVNAWVQASMLKGHAYIGFPVVKDKFGVYFGYQAFLYDWTIKRAMDVATLFNDDSDFKKQVDDYQKFIELPNFKDLELGFQWKVNDRFSLDYTLLRALDLYQVLDPVDLAESWGSDTAMQALRSVDTLALIEVPNWIHGLNARYSVNDRWTMQNTLAWQTQDWMVIFDNTDPDQPLFDLQRDHWHARTRNLYQYNDKHLFDMGASVDRTQDSYDIRVPRFVYELMIRGNYDLMEIAGLMDPNGYVISEDDPFNTMGTVLDNLMMDYEDTTGRVAGGLWFSDAYKRSDRDRFQLGARIDFEEASTLPFVSPRLAWFHKLDETKELTLGAGLYNQDNYEFYYRQFNPDLRSEKAAHLNAEWSWDIRPEYRMEVSSYGKYYWDLVNPRLTNTGEFHTSDLMEYVGNLIGYNTDSIFRDLAARNGMDPDSIYYQMDSLTSLMLDELPEGQRKAFLDLAGERRLNFPNNGTGYAIGSEVSFFYDPTKVWRGWASVELSRSERTEDDINFWYPFRNARPWAIKWQNYFRMPSNWEFSVRYQKAAGLAYTSFDGRTEANLENEPGYDENADTVLVIGRKNDSRYTSTTRIDFRFEHNTKLWGHPYMSFFEVWNAFNEPNFMLVDNETGQWKWITFGWPVPVFFVGAEVRW